jgi:aminoglycoside 6-adenylyltransferase
MGPRNRRKKWAMDYQIILDQLVDWANNDDNIRVAVLTGSGARGLTEMDDLSDLDLELYVDRPSELLDEQSWYEAFGEVLVVEKLTNPGWYPSRLIYYVEGKIDFLVAPTGAVGEAKYARPFRVLIDKDDLTGELQVTPTPRHKLPSGEEFLACVNWFYAAALMCAKCVVRGELWMAKHRDFELNDQLLHMIEWDHKTRYGEDFDTWYLGVHWLDWMDEDIRDEVAACWGHFDAQDTAHAVSQALILFRRLADRTGRTLGYTAFDYMRVDGEVRRILTRID